MLSAIIPLDHMYVNVSLDILGMDRPAQLNLISSFDYSAAPLGRVAAAY